MRRFSRDRLGSIPSHRAALLRPFTRFLADIGAPFDRGLQQVGLPHGVLERVDNYVPSQRFYRFLVDMALHEGIEDLGFHVGQRFGADSVDPHLTEMLRRSPTLYDGLRRAIELANRTVTQSRMGVWQPLPGRYAYFYHRPSCGLSNPAIDQIGWFGIMTLIGMVRVFTGPHWQPAEIGLMRREEPCLSIREQLHGARLRVSQPCSFIAVDRALLSAPPLVRGDGSAGSASSSLHYEPLSPDFVGSLNQLLQTYIGEKDLSIEFAAELCGTSKRSLQRKLANMGTRYSAVLDQARFNVASRMLQDPGMNVFNVSERLGYGHPTHFSRAFRKIAGITPREYRAARAC